MCDKKLVLGAVLFSLTLIVTLVRSAAAAPSEAARVDLSADQLSFAAGERVVVRVAITNPGSHPIKVLKWYTPVDDVEEPLFTVLRNGVPVEFVGPHYKRPAPTGSDYVVLTGGESLVREVDLGAYYNLSTTGTYTVSYQVQSWNLFSERGSAAKLAASLQSGEVVLFAEGRPSGPPALTGGATFNKCNASQEGELHSARAGASSYADAALAYLKSGVQGPRYTTWFGAVSTANYSAVRNNFTQISTAMSSAAVQFDCGCKKPYFAYVYANQPYNIFLCKAFWTAPMTGADSKAGTLVHEMSHFTVVAGTEDWVYGQAGAKNLATTDPAKAISNADNHEYFAENVAALP